MAINVIEILNTIRDNASAEYQNRIPEATRTNMDAIRYAMIDDDNVMIANEFMSTLLNKIVKPRVITKMFTNPLKGLKKGSKPLGDTIEEIYNNFLKGEEYDATGANLLKRNLPDTKTVYHRMNYKQKYKVTVSRESLSKAFMSESALETYITGIINSLYNSAELDEFMNMKELLKSAMKKKAVKILDVSNPLEGEANAKEFIKVVKTESGLMTFPSAAHNGYLTAQSTDDKPITTFSRKNEQILIIDVATDTSLNVDVLASAFNMSVAEFNDTRKIVVDAIPTIEGYSSIPAMLVDEAFFQVFDDLFTIKAFENGEGLYTNYILHVWMTLAFSILVNAIAFGVKAE